MRIRNILLLLSIIVLTPAGYSQADSTLAPYKRFHGFPPAKLLLPDSSSYFTKNDLPKKSKVMILLFNPGCEHCRHETDEIIKQIDRFSEVQIVMATFMPFDTMMVFRKEFKLAEYKNITVVKDVHFFLPAFYQIRNLPFQAFYNREKELISVFEGSMSIEKMLAELNK